MQSLTHKLTLSDIDTFEAHPVWQVFIKEEIPFWKDSVIQLLTQAETPEEQARVRGLAIATEKFSGWIEELRAQLSDEMQENEDSPEGEQNEEVTDARPE